MERALKGENIGYELFEGGSLLRSPSDLQNSGRLTEPSLALCWIPDETPR
jgi:hypothetical protein